MDLTTQAYLVTKTGLTKQAVNKAFKANYFTTVEDKGRLKIDLDGHLTVEWLKKHPFKVKTEKKIVKSESLKEPIKKTKSKPQKKDIPKADTPEGSHTSRSADKQLLELEKLEKGNTKLDIDNDKKRGHLIPKILIKRVFARLYSIFENQLKALGVSASPKISAVYNESNKTKTSQILELIERQEDKILNSEINKILNSGEEERILETTGILEDSIMIIIRSIKREFDKFLKNIRKLGE